MATDLSSAPERNVGEEVPPTEVILKTLPGIVRELDPSTLSSMSEAATRESESHSRRLAGRPTGRVTFREVSFSVNPEKNDLVITITPSNPLVKNDIRNPGRSDSLFNIAEGVRTRGCPDINQEEYLLYAFAGLLKCVEDLGDRKADQLPQLIDVLRAIRAIAVNRHPFLSASSVDSDMKAHDEELTQLEKATKMEEPESDLAQDVDQKAEEESELVKVLAENTALQAELERLKAGESGAAERMGQFAAQIESLKKEKQSLEKQVEELQRQVAKGRILEGVVSEAVFFLGRSLTVGPSEVQKALEGNPPMLLVNHFRELLNSGAIIRADFDSVVGFLDSKRQSPYIKYLQAAFSQAEAEITANKKSS